MTVGVVFYPFVSKTGWEVGYTEEGWILSRPSHRVDIRWWSERANSTGGQWGRECRSVGRDKATGPKRNCCVRKKG